MLILYIGWFVVRHTTSTNFDDDCWYLSVNEQILGNGTEATTLLSSLGPSEGAVEVKSTCDELSSLLKQKIAFTMTACHHWRHQRLNHLFETSSDGCSKLLDPWLFDGDKIHFISMLEDIQVNSCIKQLTTSGFMIYTEFLNHFDNLCYYYISKAWYSKITTSVDHLLFSSQKVIKDLQDASELQTQIKEESDSISKMTRMIYSDAHQLALQVERGEANITHLIDRVSNDVVQRARGLTENLEVILARTREVQAWTSETYKTIRGLRNYAYIPSAVSVFWLLSRSQSVTVKIQLLFCLLASLMTSIYSTFDMEVQKYCQMAIFLISIIIWVRGWVYGRSDLQKVLESFSHVQADIQQYMKQSDRLKDGVISPINRPAWYHTAMTPKGAVRTSRSIYNDASYTNEKRINRIIS